MNMNSDDDFCETCERAFSDRLRFLRNRKKISAREMSLSLGQNVNYINLIENGKRFPSMQGFFSICNYLEITPKDFFAFEEAEFSCTETSAQNAQLSELTKRLSESQQNAVAALLRAFGK